ncbi:MAG: hypothetical protein AB1714_23245 [Acidobacteriota bacterium]
MAGGTPRRLDQLVGSPRTRDSPYGLLVEPADISFDTAPAPAHVVFSARRGDPLPGGGRLLPVINPVFVNGAKIAFLASEGQANWNGMCGLD